MKNKLTHELNLFLCALSFLSILPVHRLQTKLPPERQGENISSTAFTPFSMQYFPLVGSFLACIALLPFVAGFGKGMPFFSAWIYVTFMVIITRALHWDGLADTADACLSGKKGPDFWKVMKDSRLGAMGAMALLVAYVGYIVVAAQIFSASTPFALVWAAAVGRLMPYLFIFISQPYEESHLAKSIITQGQGRFPLFWGAVLLILGFFISPVGSVVGLILATGCVWLLVKSANARGGYNGDYLGASIVIGEVVALLPMC